MPKTISYPVKDEEGHSFNVEVPEGSSSEFIEKAAQDYYDRVYAPRKYSREQGFLSSLGSSLKGMAAGALIPPGISELREAIQNLKNSFYTNRQLYKGEISESPKPSMQELETELLGKVPFSSTVYKAIQGNVPGAVGDILPQVVLALLGSPKIMGAIGGIKPGITEATRGLPLSKPGRIVGGVGGAVAGEILGRSMGPYGGHAAMFPGYWVGKELGGELHPIAALKGAISGAVKGAEGKTWLPSTGTNPKDSVTPLPSSRQLEQGPISPLPISRQLKQAPLITPPPVSPTSTAPILSTPKQLGRGSIITPSPEPLPPSRQLEPGHIWRGPGDYMGLDIGKETPVSKINNKVSPPTASGGEAKGTLKSSTTEPPSVEDIIKKVNAKVNSPTIEKPATVNPTVVNPPTNKLPTINPPVVENPPTAIPSTSPIKAVPPEPNAFGAGDVFEGPNGTIKVLKSTPEKVIYSWTEKGKIKSTKEELPIAHFEDALKSRNMVKVGNKSPKEPIKEVPKEPPKEAPKNPEPPKEPVVAHTAGPYITHENLYKITKEISPHVTPTQVARWLESNSERVLGEKVSVQESKFGPKWGVERATKRGPEYGKGGLRELLQQASDKVIEGTIKTVAKEHPEWF